VYLNFLSSNKCRIDKRRRVQGKHGATARHRDHGKMDSVTQQLQAAGDRHSRTFAVGAQRVHPREIRIRIGTDALTTACSTHPNGSAQSQAPSDPMLFDQHTYHPEQPDTHKTDESNSPKAYPPSETSVQNRNTPDCEKHWIDERAQHCHSPCRLVRVTQAKIVLNYVGERRSRSLLIQ
jgi:hypothetical protein